MNSPHQSSRNRSRSSSRTWPIAAVAAILLVGATAAAAATRTVTSVADSGPGTLREAIQIALPGDTINFAPGVTSINLTTGRLSIEKDLTISGPGANVLTIRRVGPRPPTGPSFGIFVIPTANTHVRISGVTIANGNPGSFSFLNGAGIRVSTDATLTLALSKISGNRGDDGAGGIYNDGGTVNIIDSTISQNIGGDAGGILNTKLGALTIRNSTISSNQGIGISNGGLLTMSNSTIADNSCDGGDGCGLNNFANLTVTLINCTIAANKDTGRRFGDFPSVAYGVISRAGTDLRARNTIITQNTSGDYEGTLTSQGYNLIGDGSAVTITPAQPTDQIGTSASPINPMLGPLLDNGGPTFTMSLLSGSPAKDKGHSSGFTTDQRGFSRPVDNSALPNAMDGDASDIGAFEVQTALLARSLNISTRSRVQTGDNVLIGGFIITGSVPKPVVLRAIGPSMVNAGVPAGTVLNDPVLELRGNSGALITSNDNWKESPQRAQIEGTVFQPGDDREAVIRTTLPPAAYTAVVRGKGSDTGVGLVEIYDLDQTSDSALANLSSRAFVETGNDVVIGGFTLGGNNGSPFMIIRAIGPSLAQFGIASSLANPTLDLRDANGTMLAFNDDWQDDPSQASQVRTAGLQPKNDLESAIAAALPPGAFTAIVAGHDGTTGVGVVEVYNLQ